MVFWSLSLTEQTIFTLFIIGWNVFLYGYVWRKADQLVDRAIQRRIEQTEKEES